MDCYIHNLYKGTCHKGVLTALFHQAMAPPPFRSEGAGRGLVSPPQAGVEGHEVQGTRKAEARSRQAPIRASISGQYIKGTLHFNINLVFNKDF